MKGIILAGGFGTRMYPITRSTIKQLLPVYDKPMIYYPLSTLMMAGVREILIISTPKDLPRYIELFGDGSPLGLDISYAIQNEPKGLAEAFIIAKNYIQGENVWLILGDNIFFGDKLEETLMKVSKRKEGATVFAYRVKDPERYGVVEFDKNGKPVSIVEKPKEPKSDFAQVGLYYFDKKVSAIAKKQTYSERGELEIVDVVKDYLKRGTLKVERMGSGYAWLDSGTFDSLYDSATFIKVLQTRQGIIVCSPEEVAYRKGYINKKQLLKLAEPLSKSSYGQYLLNLAKEK
ncbi:MAG: Glucose-1-phosphate thymidylyltransferase [candidate division WWE3 bacterium GW2011_GWA1_42_12]|uniref:Glucose-1-phosphate thymidylyltransferase n=1 Tax=Candidatus Woesebacteria bacterium GW2011_GWB1_40_12 TaxID=1618576 RepID=A0A0G0TTS3_9BACT|nr:MAG: Glucose-1-phosphate thymidylyltransferase [Candidatus Woesebacteria bacterium GW2011_GWB1_40_12]KKS30470.1 MAG: Glucose-1-phosphate thymidylyltransferase [candidate division WWE3 bacterium GW2011_GWA1_42_12]